MSMKFDQNGNRIGTKSKETMISSTAYTTTIAHAEPRLIQVDAGITDGYWGVTNKTGITVDVKEIIKSCADFNRYYPQDFPLEESLIDGISEASLHELTHFNEQEDLLTQDIYAAIANMGHPIGMKMFQKSETTEEAKRQVTCIDLPDEPEAPQPKEPFSTFQVGNMVLKVRNS